MDALELTGILLVLTTLLTYGNLRFLRLAHPVGVMVLALGLSAGLILLDHLSLPAGETLKAAVAEIDFSQTVLRWMLGFMLFAGGLTIRLDELLPQRRRVFGLAILGTVLFVVLVGCLIGSLLPRFSLPVTWLGCFAFATLIAPTNPDAILSFLQSRRVPPRVKTAIAGESIFSATVVAVLFFILINAATGHQELSAGNAALTFLVRDGGAIVLGVWIGFLSLWLIRQVEQDEYAVLTSIAAVVGGFALADRLGVCGPVVVASAGLCLGNAPKYLRTGPETKERLVRFWGPVIYALSTMMFVLLGLEMLVLQANERLSYVAVAVLVVWPTLLLGRLISVWMISRIGSQRERMRLPELAALTWAGPRGGVSLAMAMVLPPGPERDCWIAVTYVVVLLSIVVQGLTLTRFIPLLDGEEKKQASLFPTRPPLPSTR